MRLRHFLALWHLEEFLSLYLGTPVSHHCLNVLYSSVMALTISAWHGKPICGRRSAFLLSCRYCITTETISWQRGKLDESFPPAHLMTGRDSTSGTLCLTEKLLKMDNVENNKRIAILRGYRPSRNILFACNLWCNAGQDGGHANLCIIICGSYAESQWDIWDRDVTFGASLCRNHSSMFCLNSLLHVQNYKYDVYKNPLLSSDR